MNVTFFTEDAELVYQTTCMAGIRLPHVWLVKQRQNCSSLDVVGKGRFTLLTGIGGEGWRSAADAVRATLGVPVVVTTIGPDCDYEDPFGDWARSRCVEDDGAVLVRPDQFVAWRAKNRDGDQAAILLAVFRKLLARNVWDSRESDARQTMLSRTRAWLPSTLQNLRSIDATYVRGRPGTPVTRPSEVVTSLTDVK